MYFLFLSFFLFFQPKYTDATLLCRDIMDVAQSASSMASPIVTPASPPPADTRGPATPPPVVTQPGGRADIEEEEHVRADTSVLEREEDLGAGTKGAETEKTTVPDPLEKTQREQQQQQHQQE
jgi:hypothetical protein